MIDLHTETQLRAFLDEHSKISAQVADLRRFWQEVNELGEGPKYEEMGSRVEELRDLLAGHFEREERGGYLATAVEQAPGFKPRADELTHQHQQILDAFGNYVTRLRACDESYHCWQDVLADIDDVLELLHEHEAAEIAIVESALTIENHPTA